MTNSTVLRQEILRATFLLGDFSGDHAPEYSVLCRDGVLSVFEAYGREGLVGSHTRIVCGVSMRRDQSSSVVCLHGRVFSS